MIGVFLATVVLGLAAGLAGRLLSKFLSITAAPDHESREIRASNLALVDDRGRERAVLTLIDGRPILVLADEHSLGSGDWVSSRELLLGFYKMEHPAWS